MALDIGDTDFEEGKHSLFARGSACPLLLVSKNRLFSPVLVNRNVGRRMYGLCCIP